MCPPIWRKGGLGIKYGTQSPKVIGAVGAVVGQSTRAIPGCSINAVPSRASRAPHRNRIIGGQPVSSEIWRELRNRWQQRLPQECPRCGGLVNQWDAWDLDHVGEPVALGGRTTDIRPAHRACNRGAGGALGGMVRALEKNSANQPPDFLADALTSLGTLRKAARASSFLP